MFSNKSICSNCTYTKAHTRRLVYVYIGFWLETVTLGEGNPPSSNSPDSGSLVSPWLLLMCAAYFNLDIGRLGHKPSHQYGKYAHGSQLISTRSLVVGTQAKSPLWQTCSWIADNLNQDIGVQLVSTRTLVVWDTWQIWTWIAAFSNQVVGRWDTCQVTDIANMFMCAANFNQDIGRLGHSQVTNMANMNMDRR